MAEISESKMKWLRDQHPRGAQIIAEMTARDTGEDTTAQDVMDSQRSSESASESDVPPYEKWSTKELKAEAGARGLETTGNKSELAARLYTHDEETENS